MNEKILWKIQELIERHGKGTTRPLSTAIPSWKCATDFFESTTFFSPASSDRPVMHDGDGDYYGLAKDIVIIADKPVYIFDNHHKAMFAFLEAKHNWGSVLPVVHIDAHQDDAEPGFSPKNITLQNIRETYEKSRICDFVSVSQSGDLIGDVQRIVTSAQFDDYMLPEEPFILSLDIDIFGPEGGYIELETKIKAIADAWSQASVVTIATSPGFIDQEFGWKIIAALLAPPGNHRVL